MLRSLTILDAVYVPLRHLSTGHVGRCFSAQHFNHAVQVSVDVLDGDFEGISTLTLQRPEAKNALGRQLLAELQQALDMIRQEKTTRVLLIRSDVVGIFSAGADLKERAQMSQQEAHEFVSSLRSTFELVQKLPMPTVALVEGAALGGGAELAIACDFRICSPKARFAWPETKLGIIPGAGGTQRLPRLVGATRAKELIFTGRGVTAPEALQLGLACRVTSEAHVEGSEASSAAQAQALEFAKEITSSAPLALRMAKAAIDDGIATDLATGFRIEQYCYSQTLSSADRLEGLAAFREKRKPVFKGV